MAQSLGAAAEAVGAGPPPAGHNGIDEDTFHRFVHEMAQVDAKMEEVRGLRKSVRKRAKLAGIELGDLDATVRMMEWDVSDVRAHFANRAKYALWLRLPVGAQAELFEKQAAPPPAEPHGAGYWAGKGFQAGITGLVLKMPDECHPEHHQDFKHGYDQGQATLAPKKLKPVVEKPKLETVN